MYECEYVPTPYLKLYIVLNIKSTTNIKQKAKGGRRRNIKQITKGERYSQCIGLPPGQRFFLSSLAPTLFEAHGGNPPLQYLALLSSVSKGAFQARIERQKTFYQWNGCGP
jgi:hypothetical protein